MQKPLNGAQLAFLKGMSQMTANFRRNIDEHFALIGKATCALIEQGRPVTSDAIRTLMPTLPEGRNPEMLERAVKHLG